MSLLKHSVSPPCLYHEMSECWKTYQILTWFGKYLSLLLSKKILPQIPLPHPPFSHREYQQRQNPRKKGGKRWSKEGRWNPLNCIRSRHRTMHLDGQQCHICKQCPTVSLRALEWRLGVNGCCWFFDVINIVCLSITKNRLLPASKIFGYAHYCLLEWKAKELTEAFFLLQRFWMPWKCISSWTSLASWRT